MLGIIMYSTPPIWEIGTVITGQFQEYTLSMYMKKKSY